MHNIKKGEHLVGNKDNVKQLYHTNPYSWQGMLANYFKKRKSEDSRYVDLQMNVMNQRGHFTKYREEKMLFLGLDIWS